MIAGIEFAFGALFQFRQCVRGGRIEIDDRIAVDQELHQTEEEYGKIDGPNQYEYSNRMQR